MMVWQWYERQLERAENDPDVLRRLGLAHLFILFISMLVIVALIVIASLFITTSARRAGFARAEFRANKRGKVVGVTSATCLSWDCIMLWLLVDLGRRDVASSDRSIDPNDDTFDRFTGDHLSPLSIIR